MYVTEWLAYQLQLSSGGFCYLPPKEKAFLGRVFVGSIFSALFIKLGSFHSIPQQEHSERCLFYRSCDSKTHRDPKQSTNLCPTSPLFFLLCLCLTNTLQQVIFRPDERFDNTPAIPLPRNGRRAGCVYETKPLAK